MGLPFSMTGRWRKPFSYIIVNAYPKGLFGSIVCGAEVITSAELRRPGVQPARHDAKHRVAFGEDADEALVLDDHDCADVLLCHEHGGFADGGRRGGFEYFPRAA